MRAGTSERASEGGAWRLRPPAAATQPTPAHRPVRVPGLAGYLDPIGVKPGESLRLHLSAPAAHEIVVARLGRGALLRSEPDDAADRAQEVRLDSQRYPTAARHDVYPGSYAQVAGGDPIGHPTSVSAWVRIWRLPPTVETSSWAAVVSEMDYPGRCHWALGVDADGHPGCYVGDGTPS